jgi:hypothetical protein
MSDADAKALAPGIIEAAKKAGRDRGWPEAKSMKLALGLAMYVGSRAANMS